MAHKIIDVLKLPTGVVPITTVTIGYPAEDRELTDRLPLNGVVHYETYNDYSVSQLDEIYKQKEQLPSNLNFIKENNKETLAQVFTDVRYKRKDNVVFSNMLLEVLKSQGFMNNVC